MSRIEPRKRTGIIVATLAAAIGAAAFVAPQVARYRQKTEVGDEFRIPARAGAALVAQGRFADAIPLLEKALAAAPEAIIPEAFAARHDLAAAYTGVGRIDDAENTIKLAQTRMGALPASDLARPEYKRERVRLATASGNLLLSRGKLPEAQTMYERAVALSPDDAAAHSNLANVLYLQGKIAAAEKEYDMAHARAPENPETLANWGNLLLNTKRTHEAETKFKIALKLNPKSARYYHALGLAYRAQGRFGPALDAQQSAILHNEKMTEAFLEIADLYVELKDYRNAELYLRGALSKEVDPNNVTAIRALARLLASTPIPSQRDNVEAAILLQQAVELTHGQDINLLVELADLYALAKAFDRAQETIDLAMQRAREQKVTPLDLEILSMHALQHWLLQHPVGPAIPNPVTTLGDPFHLEPQADDPLDYPKPPPTPLPPIRIFTFD